MSTYTNPLLGLLRTPVRVPLWAVMAAALLLALLLPLTHQQVQHALGRAGAYRTEAHTHTQAYQHALEQLRVQEAEIAALQQRMDTMRTRLQPVINWYHDHKDHIDRADADELHRILVGPGR